MERRKLLTCDDIVEAPAQTCLNCAGLRFINGILCEMCGGEGKIIADRRTPIPSLTLLKISVFCIIAAGIVAFALSYWQAP